MKHQNYLGSFLALMRYIPNSSKEGSHVFYAGEKCVVRPSDKPQNPRYTQIKNALNFRDLKSLVYPEKIGQEAKLYGELTHIFDEIWFFLLHADYVHLTAYPLENYGNFKGESYSYSKFCNIKVEVYLKAKAFEDQYELKIKNYNKRVIESFQSSNSRSKNVKTKPTVCENGDSPFEMEMLKFARLSLLILFEMMAIVKIQECAINSERQYSIFQKAIDYVRLYEKRTDSQFSDSIKIVLNDLKMIKYYRDYRNKIQFQRNSKIFKDLMEIPENIYYETPRQEFIKIQIIEGLVNKYNRDMNLMDELNLLAKPMKIVLKPMLENQFYNSAQQWISSSIQKWKKSQLTSHECISKMKISEFEKKFSDIIKTKESACKFFLKEFHLSDRQITFIWNLIDLQQKLDNLKEAHFYTQQNCEKEEAKQMQKQEFPNLSQTDILETMNKENLMKIEQPSQLQCQLQEHQQQALAWMLYREGHLQEWETFTSQNKMEEEKKNLSPLWQSYKLLDSSIIYVNMFTGKISTQLVEAQKTRGGILADEMGLGKTIMTIALILETKNRKTRPNNKLGTLIVLPKAVLNQWGKELEQHVQKGSLNHHFYYKPKHRLKSINLAQFDVIFTTYSLLMMDYQELLRRQEDPKNQKDQKDENIELKEEVYPTNKIEEENKSENKSNKSQELDDSSNQQGDESSRSRSRSQSPSNSFSCYEDPPKNKQNKKQANKFRGVSKHSEDLHNLFDLEWERVVLDEAHNIRTRFTFQSRGANELKADYRWCLTGTPIQNKHDDLFGLFQFLKVETFGEYFWWNSYINKEENEDEQAVILNQILKPIMLRRLKKNHLVQEKEVKEEIIYVENDENESLIYKEFLEGCRRLFKQYNSSDINRQYIHIFQILTKLRMVCDHPLIALKDVQQEGDYTIEKVKLFFEMQSEKMSTVNENFQQEIITRFQRGEGLECPICMIDQLASISLAKCGHYFCTPCLNKQMEINLKCPNCRKDLNPAEICTIVPELNQSLKQYLDQRDYSSKVKAILQECLSIKNKGEKCLIFTQWIDMIGFIVNILSENNISSLSINGQMTIEKRDQIIRDFQDKNNGYLALILSLKASSTGLNLAVANNVLIVDPWWNVSSECQYF